jgi:fimbrial isopeptide formation D2 family protein/LPXTG-motif cell wall-anchored protein
MSVKSHAIRRAVRAGVAAAAVAAIAAVGLAAPAQAAPLVDPTAVGSIAVHKFERPETPTGLPNNGTVADTTGLTPMEGIGFSVQQVVGVDLSTNAGWAAASDLSTVFDAGDAEASITGAGYTLGSAATQTTDANGDALFSALPVGLYLVQETVYPANATPSAPFLVTIPLTDPTDLDTWLYDVHVYPKNSVIETGKTVDDDDAIQLGDELTFTITADIPNEAVIDGFRIVDPLDSKLDYVSSTVSLADGTAIVLGTDYTITYVEATNTVTVDFTAAGRAILAANNATEVVVDVVTSVNTVGEIVNQALVYPNEASFDGTPTTTPSVETRWGGLTIEKVGPTGTPLTGAVFQVFTSEADALAQANPVSIAGDNTFEVVNLDGTLTISGLRYSDFANGATVAPGDAGFIQYYLVETVAPADHELLAAPIPFTVTAATTAAGVDLQVENALHNGGFQLPLTGGTGAGMLYLTGLVLMTGGVLFLIVRRARRTV